MTDDRTRNGLDRRGFIKSTAALAAAPLFASPLRLPAGAFAGGGEVLKFGLIGVGGRGTGAATQALTADRSNVLWAVADAFQDRIDERIGYLEGTARSLAEQAPGGVDQFQCPPERRFSGFDGYKKLIDSGVDVVLMATPPYFRPEHLRAAIAAGKHVFCEKPMAVDGPGVRSVLETARLAKEKSLNLMSGFCWRFKENDRRFVAKLREGLVGDIRAVSTTYLSGPLRAFPRQEGWSDMEFQLRNWQHFNWLSGDHIVEQACHSIDKISWFMGDAVPTRAVATGGRQARPDVPETGDVFDHFAVCFEFEDGARGFHQARQTPQCFNDNSDYVLGAKGIADVNSWGPKHLVQGEQRWMGERKHLNDMYQQEHDELFALIRRGETVNHGAFMAHSTLMSIMTRMSAYTGKAVTWKEALESQERLGPESLAWGEVATSPVPIPGVTKFG